MAFDYGSIDLGLKNPFKKEGTVTAIRGAIQCLAGLYILIRAAGSVGEDVSLGWILAVFGVVLLGIGIRTLSNGILAILRYFVGRNHPTSLSQNFSRSEASTSAEESAYVAYTENSLEEMLVGRKNATFVEPRGFLARLVHSVFPKLLYMPYPIRNMAQRVFGAWVKTAIGIIAFAFVAFVSLAGFAGEAGKLAFPLYSALLVIYLILIWHSAGKILSRDAEKNIDSMGAGDLLKVISVSILMPVIIGVALSWIMGRGGIDKSQVESWFATFPGLHAVLYLVGILAAAALCTALIVVLLRSRLSYTNPLSEVSELRENWQESVHPDEIFINLDNLVMANRRYKEVPNRVYKELVPKLNEQVEGKGGFSGEMIQEIQPKVKPMDLGATFEKGRLLSLISGNILHVVTTVFIVLFAYSVVDTYQFVAATASGSLDNNLSSDNVSNLLQLIVAASHFVLIGLIFRSFANVLANAAHVFYAEIQFESLLIYFKCEGTFTESKISTGTSIHDSTRSENTLVRSSITPWVIVSRIVSTTFAATGLRNLEHPRHIMEMHKAEQDLQSIKDDVISFLKDRESIATITSARDLGNASQIHQLNQQTRAMPNMQGITYDEEAAGYLRQESDLLESESNSEEPKS